MHVRVLVSVFDAMNVGVAVHDTRSAGVVMSGHEVPGRHRLEPPERVAESQHAQDDQHRSDGHLESTAHRRRDRELEPDDDRAHDRQGRHVAGAPEGSDHRPAGEAALAGEDRRHRDEVVRVGRVLQAEEEPEHERRDRRGVQERGHSDIFRRRPVRRARRIAARNAQWASAA